MIDANCSPLDDTLCEAVKPGNVIFCADDSLSPRVKSVGADHVITEIMNNCEIGERKNCNLPGVIVDLPTITDKDRVDIIDWGVGNNVDFIAASFVRKGTDIQTIRKLVDVYEKGRNIKIISKVENQEGTRMDTPLRPPGALALRVSSAHIHALMM